MRSVVSCVKVPPKICSSRPSRLAPRQPHEAERVEVSADEFESCVRTEPAVPKPERQIAIDPGSQMRCSPRHWKWPSVEGELAGLTPRFLLQ